MPLRERNERQDVRVFMMANWGKILQVYMVILFGRRPSGNYTQVKVMMRGIKEYMHMSISPPKVLVNSDLNDNLLESSTRLHFIRSPFMAPNIFEDWRNTTIFFVYVKFMYFMYFILSQVLICFIIVIGSSMSYKACVLGIL